MDINLNSLDSSTQKKYKEFKEKVQEILAVYQETDRERFDLVKRKIEQTNGNWDTSINLISGNSVESVNISQLLAYEYCLAAERISNGKVRFEDMLDKLFKGVQKFRIGNPMLGIDDECLYGKSINDITAIPVTSKRYRMVMGAGAQHLEYFRDGEIKGAVFIYKKGILRAFAHDENGKPIDYKIDGIDFDDLTTEKQSLLTNLRQTVFHEWTHNSEKEIIEPSEEAIEYEYIGKDGNTYRNYEKANSYVISRNAGEIQEPDYIYGTYIDENGNNRKGFYYIDENGDKKGADKVEFGLEEKLMDETICISQGLETRLVLPNGETELHNIITEGFVESIARAMIRAIDPNVRDIDEDKYPEYVAVADKVVSSRDISIGRDGEGQTYADFLMHSSILKRDLESRIVTLSDGRQVDGLHYISDYANRVQNGQTQKKMFMEDENMMAICQYLKLNASQIEDIKNSGLFALQELSEEQQEGLRELLMAGENKDISYVDLKIREFLDALRDDVAFLDGIPEKLGYMERVGEQKRDTQIFNEVAMNINKLARNALEQGITDYEIKAANKEVERQDIDSKKEQVSLD